MSRHGEALVLLLKSESVATYRAIVERHVLTGWGACFGE
jgi:hypothetical protein